MCTCYLNNLKTKFYYLLCLNAQNTQPNVFIENSVYMYINENAHGCICIYMYSLLFTYVPDEFVSCIMAIFIKVFIPIFNLGSLIRLAEVFGKFVN